MFIPQKIKELTINNWFDVINIAAFCSLISLSVAFIVWLVVRTSLFNEIFWSIWVIHVILMSVRAHLYSKINKSPNIPIEILQKFSEEDNEKH
jgi:hypothetical protein